MTDPVSLSTLIPPPLQEPRMPQHPRNQNPNHLPSIPGLAPKGITHLSLISSHPRSLQDPLFRKRESLHHGLSLLHASWSRPGHTPVSYTHLRAHETKANLVCRLLLEKKKKKKK